MYDGIRFKVINAKEQEQEYCRKGTNAGIEGDISPRPSMGASKAQEGKNFRPVDRGFKHVQGSERKKGARLGALFFDLPTNHNSVFTLLMISSLLHSCPFLQKHSINYRKSVPMS